MTYDEYRIEIAIRVAREFDFTIERAFDEIGNIMDWYDDSIALDEATWLMIWEIGTSS